MLTGIPTIEISCWLEPPPIEISVFLTKVTETIYYEGKSYTVSDSDPAVVAGLAANKWVGWKFAEKAVGPRAHVAFLYAALDRGRVRTPDPTEWIDEVAHLIRWSG